MLNKYDVHICVFLSYETIALEQLSVLILNMMTRASNSDQLWLKTNIGNNVSIGSNATILPVSICDNVVIGAGSVVTKDIKKPGVYYGNPSSLLGL